MREGENFRRTGTIREKIGEGVEMKTVGGKETVDESKLDYNGLKQICIDMLMY